jgi:LmbE family N-acetylglucosaminyl deacetylase
MATPVTEGPLRLGIDRAAFPNGLRLLAIGAHSDDLEIGAGGTILRLVGEGLVSSARWVVLSGDAEREAEARAGAAAFLAGVENADVRMGGFRDGFFPYLGSAVKDFFETHKTSFEPDLILTHRGDDRHQDHRLVGHLILEYEIPKYDADPASPNVFVELSDAIVARKLELIETTFRSQAGRQWFDPEVFRATLRLRGLEGGGSRYAEGFTARKLVL